MTSAQPLRSPLTPNVAGNGAYKSSTTQPRYY
jgi:hypothetical protein